ncbi:hypothetical protein BBK36DRAFT_1129769 [Trichoderma citrinoviride]|uniref:PHD-type domain-containing protein n=1 Tax=Trichoderma citrinoviride TaxID=58853 RepID=A0A2T4AYJ7_9HYPO|nr:hypothetical protein BBK36DRAFT_1129769 [Trichoderma citrinoviride]PTB62140.1 hypothetical protein BBK36DRAFT_1129769 [Trichoderma citrinoviride]
MAESPQSQAKRRRTSTTETSKYPVVAGYRISTYAAPGTSLTLNEQRIIYHAWRKSGSPHNPLCYTCRKPGSMLHCDTCCRSYHQHCVVPEMPESQKTFYCGACTRRNWHIQPPLFNDEKSNHLLKQPADQPAPEPAAKPEEATSNMEASKSTRLMKDAVKSDDSEDSSSQPASSKVSEEPSHNVQGDVLRSLQSLRERVTMLEKENEAIRQISQTNNSRKRELNQAGDA